MDRAPYRASQVNRATAARPSAPAAHHEEQTPATTAHRAPAHRTKEKKPRTKLVLIIVAVVVAIVLVVGGCFAWSKFGGSALPIDGGKYQAVFFTNGQVYFGKLSTINKDYLKLTDIYYLQSDTNAETDSENPQTTNKNSNANVQLIKLGQEVHGPEDAMIISRDQVLFYENLKSDGKVAQTISQYKSQ